MALQTDVTLRIKGTATTALDMAMTRATTIDKTLSGASLSSGTGVGQADVIWADEATLAGSASTVLDLIGGGLIDINGAAFAPAKIKLIYVEADAANNLSNNLQLIATASTGVPFLLALSNGIVIKPGGCALLYAPTLAGLATVTATTGDNITLTNGAATNTITYRIVIVGTSA